METQVYLRYLTNNPVFVGTSPDGSTEHSIEFGGEEENCLEPKRIPLSVRRNKITGAKQVEPICSVPVCIEDLSFIFQMNVLEHLPDEKADSAFRIAVESDFTR